jgi:hypothetical protein
MFIHRHVLAVLLTFFLSLRSISGVIPANNSVVNYSTVYFEEEFHRDATEYELIYADSASWNFEVMHRRVSNKLPAFWVSDFTWGNSYYWKVKSYDKNHVQLSESEPHRFSLPRILTMDGEETRLYITRNKPKEHAGGLISIDYLRSVYDRRGNAVWTLPNIKGIVTSTTQIRDMKFTPDHTITFLTPAQAVEIDLDGNVLWKAPSPFLIGSDTITYHHAFKKTKRGTYMVLGEKKVYRKMLGSYEEEIKLNRYRTKIIGNTGYKITAMGMVLEFNGAGELIWFWDAGDYINDIDLNFKKNNEGVRDFSSHQNAFEENKAGTKVYVGFRDLSRIVRVDKKSRKVEMSYGQKYPSGEALVGNNLFKNQHDANVTTHNSIYIFNNNDALARTGVSSILELKDNVTKDEDPLLWKFDLDFDSVTKAKSYNGGNVVELPNTNLLLCAGSLNRVFEVTKTKQVVWDAFIQVKKKDDGLWKPFSQYRCNWTGSLNRYYFLAAQSLTFINKTKKPSLKIMIYNTGNAADLYHVEVFQNAVSVYKTVSKMLAAGEQTELKLNVKSAIKGVGEFFVTIRSGNARMEKRVVLQ